MVLAIFAGVQCKLNVSESGWVVREEDFSCSWDSILPFRGARGMGRIGLDYRR